MVSAFTRRDMMADTIGPSLTCEVDTAARRHNLWCPAGADQRCCLLLAGQRFLVQASWSYRRPSLYVERLDHGPASKKLHLET